MPAAHRHLNFLATFDDYLDRGSFASTRRMGRAMQTTVLRFSVALSLLAASTNLSADDGKLERDTLRNITAVHVVIEEIASDALRDGLAKEQIQTDVELRLRKAGVAVVDSAVPMLYVNANVIKGKNGVYGYSCEIRLEQPVTVLSNQAFTMAPTWSTGGTGLVAISIMPMVVRNDIGDYVDQFINAYLSVHPKQ